MTPSASSLPFQNKWALGERPARPQQNCIIIASMETSSTMDRTVHGQLPCSRTRRRRTRGHNWIFPWTIKMGTSEIRRELWCPGGFKLHVDPNFVKKLCRGRIPKPETTFQQHSLSLLTTNLPTLIQHNYYYCRPKRWADVRETADNVVTPTKTFDFSIAHLRP